MNKMIKLGTLEEKISRMRKKWTIRYGLDELKVMKVNIGKELEEIEPKLMLEFKFKSYYWKQKWYKPYVNQKWNSVCYHLLLGFFYICLRYIKSKKKKNWINIFIAFSYICENNPKL